METTPTPALVTRRGAQPLPRLALWLLCAAYLLPGVFGRDPWRNADLTSFGLMAAMADGRSPWTSPMLGGVAVDSALLPHWIGAAAIAALGPVVGAPLAARLPFVLLLGLTLALTWYATYHLARTEAAQPVAFAFGGEADPVDYARAIADAALLALIACLGLLQLGHETTPELVQLTAVALQLWALAAAPFRPRTARAVLLVALPLLAASGAPAMAVAMGIGGVLVCRGSSYPTVRESASWLGAGTVAAAGIGVIAGTWRWRVPSGVDEGTLWSILRQLAWFLWPAWPLALWTLWRWRRHLMHRHVSVPLVVAGVALTANLVMLGADRALLLGLPALAILAAFALPTLRRGAAAAIDWFSVCFFSVCAIAIWVIYVSLQTGVPAKPAANVARLAPAFVPTLRPVDLLAALVATAAWLWLVRWRTGRHREAVWKSLVLPAAGVALSWLLLMTLWRPLLDHARSARPWVEALQPLVGAQPECVSAPDVPPALVAALEVHGPWRVRAGAAASSGAPCPVLLQWRRAVAKGAPPTPPGPGWTLVGRASRPTDRNEITWVWRHSGP